MDHGDNENNCTAIFRAVKTTIQQMLTQKI